MVYLVNYSQLGERIREFRILKHMSQAALAEAVDVSTNHISRIELAERNPSLDILIRISEVLNVPVDTLLEDDKFDEDSVYLQKMKTLLHSCSPDECRRIYELVLAYRFVSDDKNSQP